MVESEVGVGTSKKVDKKGRKNVPEMEEENYLEGLKVSELAMIHRLAGNDPQVRKKTMRKLRKWLSAIASKIPDSQESRDLVDPNFVRVWKALFYCMWMADKPLPQEQLAEQISNLLPIFAMKPNILIFFIDWFFVTLSREWNRIDHFRLDKFMMLTRRFLRKSLEQLRVRRWNRSIVTLFTQIVSIRVFNRLPPVKKTRAKARIPDPPSAPLGFQIHFTDIFLEELAKVGADSLESDDILFLISPFIFEMAQNDDERLLNEIKEKVFNHLMKQSDAAFDYREGSVDLSDEDDEDVEDDNEEEGEIEANAEDDDDEDLVNGKEESDNEEMDYDQPLDPRAGQVNVILPQLDVSYEDLALKLIESGGQNDVKSKNKKILFRLARGMKELTEGRYPLALPDKGPRKPALSKKEVEEATERLVMLKEDLVGEKKHRKTKKERKREQKQILEGVENENSNDSIGSEDQSAFLVDEEFNDHVRDNYMSYLEEMEKPKQSSSVQAPDEETTDEPPGKKRMRLEEKFTNGAGGVNANSKEDGMGKKKKNKKGKNSKNSSPESSGISENENTLAGTATSKSSPSSSSNGVGDTVIVLKEKVKKPRDSLKSSYIQRKTQSPQKMESEMETMQIQKSPKQMKSRNSLNETGVSGGSPGGKKRKSLPSTPARNTNTPLSLSTTPHSTMNKRVSFVLARNLEHPHADYQDSIERSPAIPYDAAKKPDFGLLKARAKGGNLSLNSTPRKRAADFF